MARSKFRSKFRLNYDDQLFAEMKGPEVLRQHAHDLIIKRLAPEEPLKDGKQTPVKGTRFSLLSMQQDAVAGAAF